MASQIQTPALVEVVATCPNCSERAPMLLHVATVLEVGDDTSALKLKAKSKKVDHLCGQIELPLKDDVAGGQTSLAGAIVEKVAEVAEAEGLGEVSRGEDGSVTITTDVDKVRDIGSARPRGARPRSAES